jgi:hypothetical protein
MQKFTYKPAGINRAKQYTARVNASAESLAMSGASYTHSPDCLYAPHYICGKDDFTLFDKLRNEMTETIAWSKHMKIENPDGETMKYVVDKLAADFKIKVCKTRLNYYRDGADWKPFHHDSHIGDENYTIGASFGAERAIEFTKHELNAGPIDATGKKFRFPQRNGDVFGFDSTVNSNWAHGVPIMKSDVGERFSIIVWGVR